AAGIPMLPVVFGEARASRIVLTSSIALAVASVLPILAGAGITYLIGALLGSAWFVYKAWSLVKLHNRKAAISCFLASLVQLNAVLIFACVDAALRS
ncbi:UbiA family prenyltransferase, partial [Dokdonella sp.]|uniref:UbiA family prenyltransferase n=1 Tax=Dokdonella sp. TaxID=2291710 RepID=UPI003784287A